MGCCQHWVALPPLRRRGASAPSSAAAGPPLKHPCARRDCSDTCVYVRAPMPVLQRLLKEAVEFATPLESSGGNMSDGCRRQQTRPHQSMAERTGANEVEAGAATVAAGRAAASDTASIDGAVEAGATESATAGS
eukprot:Amastigsp_a324_176.p1 type:complete len:135 gc:universal Amastigsp_a324_176:679-275(-)